MFITRIGRAAPGQNDRGGSIRIAEGDIDEASELPVHRPDEVGVATAAFNRVMDKAHELLREQRLARIVFENSLEA